ncbi:MAG: ExbD/TolR family protein [Rhodothalassiaceae bacterium]
MRKFAKQQDEAEINMTPMLDIVFIMLIFFIVTASFVKEQGLEQTKPPPSTNEPPDEEKRNCVIRVTNSNRIMYGFREIDESSIRPNIEQCRATNPEAVVIIQAEPDADAEFVIAAQDQARQVNRNIPITVKETPPR